MIRTLARYHVLLWIAGVALLAIGLAWVSPRPYDDGGLGSLVCGLTWPLAIPLGFIPYLLAEILVQRLAARK